MGEILQTLKREYYGQKVRAMDAMVYLTNRCTSRCKTCNIWKRNAEDNSRELGWNEWAVILNKLKAYGIKTLEIFGGDALLRKDIIYNVIRFCDKNGIETFFPTNSILLDRETAKGLVDAGLGTVYISIDDVGLKNDAIRGKDGSFNMVKSALENICRERGSGKRPHIVICTTISSLNFTHFQEIVNFLKNYPVNAIYPRVVGEFNNDNIRNSAINGITPEPYFTTSDGDSHLLTKEQVKEFRNLIAEMKSSSPGIYINYGAIDAAGDRAFTEGVHESRRCLICSTLITIDPFGNVVPCPMYNRYTIGNLLDDELESVWGNMKHRIFIKEQKKKKIKICENCIMRVYYPTIGDTCAHYLKKVLPKFCNRTTESTEETL